MSLAVGLDIGNRKCVLAISKNGVADAVLNKDSKRETPTVVHFAEKDRLFGAAGASRITANPSSTITQLKRLVGRHFEEENFQAGRHLLPYETIKDDDGGISVKVNYFNKESTYTAVEMLAMVLSHIKKTAKQVKESNCVMIGVPAYFTIRQKRAYWDAAVIAGWKRPKFVPEGVATALTYKESRTGPGTTSESKVLFVDIGHCNTQVTAVRFQGEEMRVLGEAWDANLGGRDFDEVIFEHFMGVFGNQYGRDIRADVKASVRLRTACEKAKLVLSANKEADVSIDYLMEGVEYASGIITRDKFEELSQGLLDRIGGVFHEALKRAKVDVKEIDSVELVGSGSLIPAISRTLTALFGRGLSRTLNGSECIARGCAILCEKINTPNLLSNSENDSYLRDLVETFENTDMHSLSTSIEKEASLAKQGKYYESTKDARNALEWYVYEVRKEVKRSENYPAESKIEISKNLDETEEWLCGYGEDASRDDYLTRLYKLGEFVSSTRALETPAREKKTFKELVEKEDGKEMEKELADQMSESTRLNLAPAPGHEGCSTGEDKETVEVMSQPHRPSGLAKVKTEGMKIIQKYLHKLRRQNSTRTLP